MFWQSQELTWLCSHGSPHVVLAIIIVSCSDKMPKGYHRLIDIARQITLCITPSAKLQLFRTLQNCRKKKKSLVIIGRYFMIYDLESFLWSWWLCTHDRVRVSMKSQLGGIFKSPGLHSSLSLTEGSVDSSCSICSILSFN